ncbi:MAG: transcriptional repressor [Planctomycetota bacterium]
MSAEAHQHEPPVPSEDALRTRLHENGLRMTPARLAVAQELARAGVPLPHGEVVDRLRPNPSPNDAADPPQRRFDQSTVFRGLSDLSDAGLLTRLDLGDSVRRYEWLPDQDETVVHPHHVCTECGRITCLEDSVMKLAPSLGLAGSAIGTITDVVLRGMCEDCASAAE